MKYRELTPQEAEAYEIGYKVGNHKLVITDIEWETETEHNIYRKGYMAGLMDFKRNVSNVSNVSNVNSYNSYNSYNSDKDKDKDKDKDIDFAHRESFIHATPEELLAALKRDIVPNLGAYLYMGEEPSDEQLINYLQTRISTNWEKKGGGIIRNVGSDLACWLKNPLSSKQMAKEDKSPMSDEPLSYEEMIAQKRFNG